MIRPIFGPQLQQFFKLLKFLKYFFYWLTKCVRFTKYFNSGIEMFNSIQTACAKSTKNYQILKNVQKCCKKLQFLVVLNMSGCMTHKNILWVRWHYTITPYVKIFSWVTSPLTFNFAKNYENMTIFWQNSDQMSIYGSFMTS